MPDDENQHSLACQRADYGHRPPGLMWCDPFLHFSADYRDTLVNWSRSINIRKRSMKLEMRNVGNNSLVCPLSWGL